MTTYYVRSDAGGAGDGSANTSVAAWTMEQFNAASPAAGDTVYFTGTFTGVTLTPKTSGSAGSPIVLEAGSATIVGTNVQFAVLISGKEYITLRGLTVTGVVKASSNTIGIYIAGTCNNIGIEDCNVSGVRSDNAAYGNGIYGLSCANGWVTGCTVTDVDCDGIWWRGDNTKVLNNTISDVGKGSGVAGDCIQFSADYANVQIIGNRCDHSSVEEKQCIILSGAAADTGVVVANNWCKMAPYTGLDTKTIFIEAAAFVCRGNYVENGKYGIWSETDGSYIYGNILVNVGVRGIPISYTGAEVSYIYNNTIVGGCSDGGIFQSSAAASGATQFKNNLVVNCTGKGMYVDGANTILDSNCAYGNGDDYGGTPGSATNNLTSNPLLAADYSLGSGSPCRGTGIWIAGVRAYDDLPLPLHPDIGAVQDRSAPGRRFGVGGGTL